MKRYDRLLGNDARHMIRERIRSDPLMPRTLKFLRAKQLRDISDALGGVDPRSLVDLRYHLGTAFVQQLRTMRGDKPKPNKTKRRLALKSLVQKAEALREEAEHNLPWLRDEHNAASFFSAIGPDPSPFEYDYISLIDAVNRLEGIATSILSVPPIGTGSSFDPSIADIASGRIENPGTWARVAFARRIGQIYHDLTGAMPGVTKEQDGPYQRMVALASAAFSCAYKDIGQPLGSWRPPSRGNMEAARDSLGPKSG